MTTRKFATLLIFAFGAAASINCLAVTSQHAADVATNSVKPLTDNTLYRIIPLKQYTLGDELPPALTATFSIKCNQEFLKVIREDVVNPVDEGKVIVLIGGLVSEQKIHACAGEPQDLSAKAGPTFSGREFEVRSLK